MSAEDQPRRPRRPKPFASPSRTSTRTGASFGPSSARGSSRRHSWRRSGRTQPAEPRLRADPPRLSSSRSSSTRPSAPPSGSRGAPSRCSPRVSCGTSGRGTTRVGTTRSWSPSTYPRPSLPRRSSRWTTTRIGCWSSGPGRGTMRRRGSPSRTLRTTPWPTRRRRRARGRRRRRAGVRARARARARRLAGSPRGATKPRVLSERTSPRRTPARPATSGGGFAGRASRAGVTRGSPRSFARSSTPSARGRLGRGNPRGAPPSGAERKAGRFTSTSTSSPRWPPSPARR